MVKHWYQVAQILLVHFRHLLIVFIGCLLVLLVACMPIVKNFHTCMNSNAPCFSDNMRLLLKKEKDYSNLKISVIFLIFTWAFILLSSSLWRTSLMFYMCTCSCACVNDAIIMCSGDGVSWKQRPLRPQRPQNLKTKTPHIFEGSREITTSRSPINATERWALVTRILRLLSASDWHSKKFVSF